MTTRNSITSETIVAAALDLIREGGWAAVSARGIASRLGASTMPIYTGIGSMNELKTAAFVRASSLLEASQHKRRTDNEALDLAIGYVVFAREEPGLFQFIFSCHEDMAPDVLRAASEEDAPGSIAGIPDVTSALGSIPSLEGRGDFIMHTWIFTHGLAGLVASGALKIDEKEITRRLEEAGAAFYLYELGKEKEQ
ncbi:MAG: TetR family transcriptional regulator [Spirochaetes bacterium]|nr:TetR family transcriptional regulator [Spirochaetota bacterium]MBU1080666.1 TetR family transcriptional regulator [Spirochaetota bacterium]